MDIIKGFIPHNDQQYLIDLANDYILLSQFFKV